MDLSAVIFVVLALAWAVYLIPKALQHHDEMASDRLVEGHSERVRILRRRSTPTETVEVETEVTEVTSMTEERRPRRESAPKPELTPAGSAARRRRRVLAGLVLLGVVLAGMAHLGYVPWWSTVFPVVMVAAFLVIARLSVRSAQRSSLVQRRPVQERIAMSPVAWPEQVEPAQLREEQVDLDVRDPEPEQSEVLADDGSLWDPLPMTLPTYVNKARARRTVRTIELTGMHSSGHDEDDSALAREAAAATEPPAEEGPSRRVAGA